MRLNEQKSTFIKPTQGALWIFSWPFAGTPLPLLGGR